MKRVSLKVVGQSGSGLLSTGDIMIKALKNAGYYVCADREFPSLIKGGVSSYQIDISDEPVQSLAQQVDIIVAVDRVGAMCYVDKVRDGGVFLHGDERADDVQGFYDTIKSKKLREIYIPEHETTSKLGGNELMSNMILLGAVWQVLGLDYQLVADEVSERFANKPVLLKIDLACLDFGYTFDSGHDFDDVQIDSPGASSDRLVLDGNEIIALSAIHHGVRNYYAYPMSPSTTILASMAKWASKTGITVKQAEDEISVVQMAIGSMYAGSRALCATSGGGFALMVESISLAGMIENPLVVVNCQRPGPATGLPTWTAQGDLNMMIHAGHGDFAKMVVSVSDPETSFRILGEAFNFAEEFQIPVMVLTERSICDTKLLVDSLPTGTVEISRGITEDTKDLTPDDRFAFTDSGISKRWLPGSCDTYYYANGDEHREDGTLTEDADEVNAMVEKRMRKIESLKQATPEPRIFGPEKADISFVGWGSSLMIMKDIIAMSNISVNYLHYDYVWPLKTSVCEKFFADNPNVHLIENNATGQLGTLIEDKTGLKFSGKLLKHDGRRFFIEEVVDYITSNT